MRLNDFKKNAVTHLTSQSTMVPLPAAGHTMQSSLFDANNPFMPAHMQTNHYLCYTLNGLISIINIFKKVAFNSSVINYTLVYFIDSFFQ